MLGHLSPKKKKPRGRGKQNAVRAPDVGSLTDVAGTDCENLSERGLREENVNELQQIFLTLIGAIEWVKRDVESQETQSRLYVSRWP